jgi:hypothetical protein
MRFQEGIQFIDGLIAKQLAEFRLGQLAGTIFL